jgi:hypothetical protein
MSRIFHLSIGCIAGRYLTEEFRFVLDVPADSTLDDLASFILGMIDFDGDHLSAFDVANGLRGKKTWFTADGEWDEDNGDMGDIRLSNVFPLGRNKKLYYVYDFGSSWCFEIIKKGRETDALVGQDYPCIVSQEGGKPLEYGGDPAALFAPLRHARDGLFGARKLQENELDAVPRFLPFANLAQVAPAVRATRRQGLRAKLADADPEWDSCQCRGEECSVGARSNRRPRT